MAEFCDGVGRFISAVGWPIAFGVFACLLFWKALGWLDKQWEKRETRIMELSKRVDAIANGQRQSLERRLDETAVVLKKSNDLQMATNETLDRVAAAMDSWSRVIQHCKEVTGPTLTEEEKDNRAIERIDRRKRRAEKRDES